MSLHAAWYVSCRFDGPFQEGVPLFPEMFLWVAGGVLLALVVVFAVFAYLSHRRKQEAFDRWFKKGWEDRERNLTEGDDKAPMNPPKGDIEAKNAYDSGAHRCIDKARQDGRV